MRYVLLPWIFLLACAAIGVQGDLEVLPDRSELLKLTEQESYVVVLFAGGDEAEEESLERELSAIREDLVDSLNAWVVKVHDDDLKRELDPSLGSKAAIVFYRSGFPVLYRGEPNEEELLETLLAYREKCIRDLADSSFEHLTQASTGATTGDWFVFFFKDEDPGSQELMTRMETLACMHRGRLNVARVNRATTGAVTGRRFRVDSVPALIFLRHGRMYPYESSASSEALEIPAMSKFITASYKDLKGASIPLPKSAFDDLVQYCVDVIKENTILVVAGILVSLVLVGSFIYLAKSEEPKSKKKKKKT
eukprot:TRINITY_DN14496_c0_g1_i1.p1 TRINITY_DN14496_c0_g1~~TRINITY_DN14496_c0_g1_i1.p1  ORF type:complete len:308 (-),score=91.96 TRINITY_DN14496_c0_g1_i1:215-1138(-)